VLNSFNYEVFLLFNYEVFLLFNYKVFNLSHLDLIINIHIHFYYTIKY